MLPSQEGIHVSPQRHLHNGNTKSPDSFCSRSNRTTHRPMPPRDSHTRRRIVARAISSDFCADWKDPITLGSSLGYGFLSALSLGGSAGVVAAKNRNYLICGLTILGNSTRRGLEAINRELSELRLYTQQTRYAIDYLLAQQGGVCMIVGDKCITNVRDESLNITEAINAIKDQLDDFRQGPKVGEDWLFGGGWGTWIMHSLVIVVVMLLFSAFQSIIKCLLTRYCGEMTTMTQLPERYRPTASEPPRSTSATDEVEIREVTRLAGIDVEGLNDHDYFKPPTSPLRIR
ncbi:syncytin-1-like [Heterodontus francisci]|uniref:syncytin-1-like n=1 Tax=Heterodontus francisci TaxID=7792 RepID=UPI00355B7382